jgi:hypothetical protein
LASIVDDAREAMLEAGLFAFIRLRAVRGRGFIRGLAAIYFFNNLILLINTPLGGGWGGIRTHGELAPSPVFKTGALNRSATHPNQRSASSRSSRV